MICADRDFGSSSNISIDCDGKWSVIRSLTISSSHVEWLFHHNELCNVKSDFLKSNWILLIRGVNVSF